MYNVIADIAIKLKALGYDLEHASRDQFMSAYASEKDETVAADIKLYMAHQLGWTWMYNEEIRKRHISNS